MLVIPGNEFVACDRSRLFQLEKNSRLFAHVKVIFEVLAVIVVVVHVGQPFTIGRVAIPALRFFDFEQLVVHVLQHKFAELKTIIAAIGFLAIVIIRVNRCSDF